MVRRVLTYDDSELSGLELSQIVVSEWASKRYATLAALTSELTGRYPEIPRSAIFWLSYHVLFPHEEITAEADFGLPH